MADHGYLIQTTPSPPSELILQPYPSDPQARTVMEGNQTVIYFFNDLPNGSKAFIYEIDDQGNRTLVSEVHGPDGSHSLKTTTYPHQPWGVKFSFREETRIYYAAPEPSCVMLNMDTFLNYLPAMPASVVRDVSSPNGGAYTMIKFENRLRQSKVQIFWVNSDGERVPYGTINPGGSSLQPTHVGHVWEVFAEYAALPFAVFYATPRGGIARIESHLLPLDGTDGWMSEVGQ